jgi:hypothetical protein
MSCHFTRYLVRNISFRVVLQYQTGEDEYCQLSGDGEIRLVSVVL